MINTNTMGFGDFLSGKLGEVWDKTAGWAKDKIRGALAEDEPDPLPGSEQYRRKGLVIYYAYLAREYNKKVEVVKGKMQPLERKIEELENRRKQFEEDRIARLASLEDLKAELERKNKDKKFFAKGRPMRTKLEDEAAALERTRTATATLPETDPEVTDDLLSPHPRQIKISLYLRELKSALGPLKKEAEYFKDHYDRSHYWFKEELRKRIEKKKP